MTGKKIHSTWTLMWDLLKRQLNWFLLLLGKEKHCHCTYPQCIDSR